MPLAAWVEGVLREGPASHTLPLGGYPGRRYLAIARANLELGALLDTVKVGGCIAPLSSCLGAYCLRRNGSFRSHYVTRLAGWAPLLLGIQPPLCSVSHPARVPVVALQDTVRLEQRAVMELNSLAITK